MRDAAPVLLVGRSSSHFTRVAAIFAHELRLPFELVVVQDPMSFDAAMYGGHPAFKIPTLCIGESALFGTENICRKLTELAGRSGDLSIVFPEHVSSDVGRCAQELVWHAMTVQVQLVIGTLFGGLPPDNVFFAKARQGMQGALAWLDAHLSTVLSLLPTARDLSVFEVTLFCLVEHLSFRPTISVDPYLALSAFAANFAKRASAQRTRFRLDPVPPQSKEPL